MTLPKRYARSVFEVRVQRINESSGTLRIEDPESGWIYWREKIQSAQWFDPEKECCVAILLNTRHSAIGHSLVSMGTVNESLVHAREVFRAAVAMGAFAILLAHNHPSGDPSPSEADLRLTRRLAEVSQILQIPLLDHLIVGTPAAEAKPSYYSMKEAGVL